MMNYVFHLVLPSISTSQGPEGKLIIFPIFRKKTVKLQIVGKQLKQSTECTLFERAHAYMFSLIVKSAHIFLYLICLSPEESP